MSIRFSEPQVAIPINSRDGDAVVRFTSAEQRAAEIRIDLGDGRPRLTLYIARTDEGVVLDLYARHNEDQGTVATTCAFDAEVRERTMHQCDDCGDDFPESDALDGASLGGDDDSGTAYPALCLKCAEKHSKPPWER